MRDANLAAMTLGSAHSLALDLTALAWAFAFVGCLACANAAGVLAGLAAIGREVDSRVAGAAPA